jgi:hypothetical protein
MIRNLAFGHFPIDEKPVNHTRQQAPYKAQRPITTDGCRALGAALSGPVRVLSVEEIARQFPGTPIIKTNPENFHRSHKKSGGEK